MSSVKYWVSAAEEFPVVPEGDMLRKSINESSEPVVGRLASTTGSQKEHSGVELFSWEHASPRQARKRDVSRHIWRAWQQPRDMRTGRSL